MKCHSEIIKTIGEGIFAVVLRTKCLKDGKYYVCKTVKQPLESNDGLYFLFAYLSFSCHHMDLVFYQIGLFSYPMPESRIHNYMYQLCKSLDHIHNHGLFHREIKPENNLIKLGDFGSTPECLVTDRHYSHKYSLISLWPLFPGSNELDQGSKIHDVPGTPKVAVLRKFKP
uniref:Protein kinase domain-containing protein n=1 Tax=Oncorhynchus mykiss TaxID=8022 RepID=A0A8C7LQL4_ONCMY